MAATASASAQVMVISVYNNAHECYAIAKAGNSPLEGIDYCNQALQFEHKGLQKVRLDLVKPGTQRTPAYQTVAYNHPLAEIR